MKKFYLIVVPLLLISLVACSNPCRDGHTWEDATCEKPMTCTICGATEGGIGSHTWIYNVDTGEKVCSECVASEQYIPSGYFLSSYQIEMDSFKPYFNEEHILCAYDEKTYEKFNYSKETTLVNSLIEDGKVFYAESDSTCDILPDTNMLAPQRHIVITSGKYNGVECWTAMAVVMNDDDVDLYSKWLDDPKNPINKEKSSIDIESNTPENDSEEYVGIIPGTYLIGTDIPAGTYRLVPAYSEYPGYWKRSSNASGEPDSIIANDLFESATYVTVESGEYLQISRCTGALQ